MNGLLIPVTGPIQNVNLTGSLAQANRLVGGMAWSRPLPKLPGFEFTEMLYLDAGELIGLPVNHRAMTLLTSSLTVGAIVVGPVVVAAFDPVTGGRAPLPLAVHGRVRLIEREAGLS